MLRGAACNAIIVGERVSLHARTQALDSKTRRLFVSPNPSLSERG